MPGKHVQITVDGDQLTALELMREKKSWTYAETFRRGLNILLHAQHSGLYIKDPDTGEYVKVVLW